MGVRVGEWEKEKTERITKKTEACATHTTHTRHRSVHPDNTITQNGVLCIPKTLFFFSFQSDFSPLRSFLDLVLSFSTGPAKTSTMTSSGTCYHTRKLRIAHEQRPLSCRTQFGRRRRAFPALKWRSKWQLASLRTGPPFIEKSCPRQSGSSTSWKINGNRWDFSPFLLIRFTHEYCDFSLWWRRDDLYSLCRWTR